MYDANNLDDPVWGVAAIARIAGLTEKAARYKIRANHLRVKKVGGQFVATRRMILDQIKE